MEKDDQIKSKNNFNEKNLKIQDVCKDDEEDCSSKGIFKIIIITAFHGFMKITVDLIDIHIPSHY